MTSTASDLSSPPRPRPARSVLRAVAIAACVPYLSLKIAWIAGSRIGIPADSVLLEHRGTMAVANTVTVLMDAAVIVLALLLTRPWGRRVNAWLLALPVWAATGLLAPIMVGFPLQLVAVAFGGTKAQDADAAEPFLHDWVFHVVYGGFILQGIALGALFILYANDRWGRVWRGLVWELPSAATSGFMRACAVLGAAAAVLPLVMHVLWAAGSTAGLPADRVAQRTTDFFLLEGARIAFVAAAVVGVLLLAFRHGPSLPVKVPLGMAWVGAASMGAWGGWLLVAALMPTSDDGNAPTAVLTLTYAVEMISGLLLSAAVASLLRRRGA